MDAVETSGATIKLYKDLSKLWGKVGMHAQKWISDESEVLKEIPEEDKAKGVDFKCGAFLSDTTLELLWKAKDYAFTFKDVSAPCCEKSEHTKGSFLKNLKIFLNLLGFFSPYIVQRKSFIARTMDHSLSLG